MVKLNGWLPILSSERSELVATSGATRHCGRGLGAQPPVGSRGEAPGGGLGGRSPPGSRGLGAQPPAGSRGGAPGGGLGGRSPPENF